MEKMYHSTKKQCNKFQLLLVFLLAFASAPVVSLSAQAWHTHTVTSVTGLQSILSPTGGLSSGDVIKLTLDFVDDLKNSTAPTAPTFTYNGSHNIIIDGDSTTIGALLAPTAAGSLHFYINNTGTGTGAATITLKNMKIDGGGTQGGIHLGATGNYVIDGCTFRNIANNYGLTGGENVLIQNSLFIGNATKRAVYAYAPTGSAYTIVNCTFLNNSAGAILLSGGGASEAERVTHTISSCYFADNELSGGNWPGSDNRGAAVYIGGNYYTFNITGSVFKRNKVIGTSTDHGGNNRVDGGALCVSGEYGSSSDPNVFNLTNSDFEDNFAQDDGGAIIVLGAKTLTQIRSSIRNCTFTGNTVAGAQYGQFIFWVTDGTGGAINYFGMTESEITHCTFYNNGITNKLASSGFNINYGSVGGGGAVGVDTDEILANADINSLPPCPVLSNNIFVGNYVKNPCSQDNINLINTYTSNSLGNITERSKTGNVFVFRAADSDRQATDSRTMNNNGNIGYDNGNPDSYGNPGYGADFNNNGKAPHGTTVGIKNPVPINIATVFANTTITTINDVVDTIPVKEYYGAPVGAEGYTAQRFCYIPSPISDEMYRDGSGPYHDAIVREDVRGYPRDHYPNAGAVEIYWTKFDPGVNAGGYWTTPPPGGIGSLLHPDTVFYLITNPAPDNLLTTFPRYTFAHPLEPGVGFQGWESNQPDNPADPPASQVFPIVQPSVEVASTKQTYTALWKDLEYRVDFNLMHDKQWGTPYTGVAANTLISPPPVPVWDCNIFAGWYTDSVYSNPWIFTSYKITQDTILYAKWNTNIVPDGNGIVYVTVNGAGNGNGSSWDNAYAGLADPLLAAQTVSCIKEIWVAKGTYYPQYNPADIPTADPRDRTFRLAKGVNVYGGFAGTETSIEARGHPLLNETILSGDLDGNDIAGTPATKTDNALHVVISVDIPNSVQTIFDGFTITGGYADDLTGSVIFVNGQQVDRGSGGGMQNIHSSLVLNNLAISGNHSGNDDGNGGGGGMYNGGSELIMTHVTVSENNAYMGGGIFNFQSSLTLTGVTINENSAETYGGGILYEGNANSLAFTHGSISGNRAGSDGGGMFNGGTTISLINVIISGNRADNNGGGMYNTDLQPSVLTNVTISGNSAGGSGGGIHTGGMSAGTTLRLTNSILWGNIAPNSPNVGNNMPKPTYAYSLIQDSGSSGWNADFGTDNGNNIDGDPLFVNRIDPASPGWQATPAGDYRLQTGSPCIEAGDSTAYLTARSISGFTDETDLADNPRLAGANIDMGAYETLDCANIVFDIHTSDITVASEGRVTAIEFGADAAVTCTWSTDAASAALVGLSPASGTGDIPAFTAAKNTSENPVSATVTVIPHTDACNGDEKTFTITVNPVSPDVTDGPVLKFDLYALQEWNNTWFLNMRKLTAEGYDVVSCRWFEQQPGAAETEMGVSTDPVSGFSCSKGPNRTDVLISGAAYHFVLELADGSIVRSSIHIFSPVVRGTLSVYPNPALQGEPFTVQTDMPDEWLHDAIIRIYSNTGQLVREKRVNGKNTRLDIHSSGMFIIKVKDQEAKIIVQ